MKKFNLSQSLESELSTTIAGIKTLVNIHQGLTIRIYNDGSYILDYHKKGYYVGLNGVKLSLNEFNQGFELYSLLYDSLDNLAKQLVGFWLHDGFVYVDLVKWCYSKQFAIETAKQYNQLAIYDIANHNEIFI